MDKSKRFGKNILYKAMSLDGKIAVVGHVHLANNNYFITYNRGSGTVFVQVKPETILAVEVIEDEFDSKSV